MIAKSTLAKQLAEIQVSNWIIAGDQPFYKYEGLVVKQTENNLILSADQLMVQINNITVRGIV